MIDEVGLKSLEVLAPFGEDDWRTASPDQLCRLVGDQPCPVIIVCESAEDLLNRGVRGKHGGVEAGIAANDTQLQRMLLRRPLGDRMSDGPALHCDDRMVSVASAESGGKARHVARRDGLQDPLGRHGGDVVALVDDHVTVVGQQFLQRIAPRQALDHRHVEQAGWFLAASTDRAERVRIDVKELRQAFLPLLKQGLAVDEDQG